MDIIQQLDQFEGKRNCALTFFIPPDYNFQRDLLKVDKSITTLKHKNKKYQLMQVMKEVYAKLNDDGQQKPYQCSGNGIIICCGMNKMSTVQHFQCLPAQQIESFEYFFDYVFNMNKIRHYLFDHITYPTTEEEFISYRGKLSQSMRVDMVLYQQELEQEMNNVSLSHLYYFSDQPLPLHLLEYSVQNKCQVVLMDTTHQNNLEFSKKYGKTIGVLRWK